MNRDAVNRAAAEFLHEKLEGSNVVGATKSGRTIAEFSEPGPAEKRWRFIESILKGES